MAQYKYLGVDKKGQRVSGIVEAVNETEAKVILRAQQIRVQSVSKPSVFEKDLKFSFSKGVGEKDIAVMTRQFSLMISSGIPMLQCFDILVEQEKNQTLKKALLTMKTRLSEGVTLWQSFYESKLFESIYISMVRAGEAGGVLETIFKRLAKYLEDSVKLKQMIKGALIYPVIVVVIGMLVTIVMLTFIIPKFEEMLKAGGQELPAITQFVINLSHFFQANFIFIMAGLIGGTFALLRYIKTPKGKELWDRFILRLPLFGNLVQKAVIARFTKTLATMLTSGINILDALDIAKTTVDNFVVEKAIERVRMNVTEGKSIAAPLSKERIFPAMCVQMIAVGEATGALDQMLEKVADFYEQEVEQMVAGLSKAIEPIVLLVLGTIIGGLLISMYLPIFKLAGSAGGA